MPLSVGIHANTQENADSQISFTTDLAKQDDTSLERILQRVDSTFTCINTRGLVATNAQGF